MLYPHALGRTNSGADRDVMINVAVDGLVTAAGVADRLVTAAASGRLFSAAMGRLVLGASVDRNAVIGRTNGGAVIGRTNVGADGDNVAAGLLVLLVLLVRIALTGPSKANKVPVQSGCKTP